MLPAYQALSREGERKGEREEGRPAVKTSSFYRLISAQRFQLM